MPVRRELPRDWEPFNDGEQDCLSDTTNTFALVGHGESRPDTEWEALMTVPPFAHTEVSRSERLQLRDVIVDAIDELSEEQRWIFDALFVRRMSLRALAEEIQVPKTTLTRRRDTLLAVLREKLEVEPSIADYLGEK